MTPPPRVIDFMIKLDQREKLDPYESSIVAFSRNTVAELARIMILANKECIPVANCPWTKQFKIGYIHLNDIIQFVND